MRFKAVYTAALEFQPGSTTLCSLYPQAVLLCFQHNCFFFIKTLPSLYFKWSWFLSCLSYDFTMKVIKTLSYLINLGWCSNPKCFPALDKMVDEHRWVVPPPCHPCKKWVHSGRIKSMKTSTWSPDLTMLMGKETGMAQTRSTGTF